MRSRQRRTALGLAMVVVMIAAIVVGCFAGSGSWAAGPNGDEVGTPVEWQPEPSLNGGLQRFASYDDLKDFLKTDPSYPGYRYYSDDRGNVVFSLGFGDAKASSEEGSNDYSRTNIQVQGVDEADIVKCDGEYIYLAVDNRLVIARAYPPEKAGVVYRTELEGNIEGLFINGDRLAVLEAGWLDCTSDSLGTPSDSYTNRTSVKVYDVSDREKPVLEREVSVDGYYVSSRMIGDYVYLIANGSAWAGEDKVGLPRIYGNNGYVEIQPAEIWHSVTPDNGYGFTTIMSVNVANDDEEPVHETLLLGSASTIYVSPSNIYITFPDWSGESQSTSIHRIHIDEGQIEYQATGEVPGTLLNQFSMDEHGEYFRVATTIGAVWGGETKSTGNVYVLDQSLDISGSLENLAPGEQIHSARFMGSRCYLVTFKKVDPLFVIDLANPGEPKVLGELKITGYSDYLHPYDENHVIGIGKETIAAENGDFAWYQGVKISLFDVSDVANPKEIAKYEIGDRGTDSPVLYDHKACLFDRSKNLLVLPVRVAEIDPSQYPGDMPSWAYGEFVWQGAYVFGISLEHGLQLKGRITHCSGDYLDDSVSRSSAPWSSYYGYSSCSIERSLYIGDVLYTISDLKIGMNDLETLEEIGEISLE
jgi:inhibitor of cysteine peptidase